MSLDKTLPTETSPCLLIANGRQASGFQVSVMGSKVSTLRNTTLSSSPPTATTTSTKPVNQTTNTNFSVIPVVQLLLEYIIYYSLSQPPTPPKTCQSIHQQNVSVITISMIFCMFSHINKLTSPINNMYEVHSLYRIGTVLGNSQNYFPWYY